MGKSLDRRTFVAAVAAGAIGAAGALGVAAARPIPRQPEKMNVLMIAIDDLRPQTGCYGDPVAYTPNIDALARRGTVFERAYCQQALCSPSRSSLLTGRRPDTTRIYNLQTHIRSTLPDVVTLPQHFMNNGYHAQGFGKIYHGGLNDPASWSVPWWGPKASLYFDPTVNEAVAQEREKRKEAGEQVDLKVLERDPKTGAALRVVQPESVRGPAWEASDAPERLHGDAQTATRAVETLKQIKGKPFFLAVGFSRPHLPFVAPKRYFERFPLDRIKLAPNRQAPKNVPEIAMHNFAELRSYTDIPDVGPVSDAKAKELIRGYYAASSFVDAQIGRVLDELDRLKLRDKTIVVLWGDHGWQLGEHGLWCKHTNFETGTRSVLIVSDPRVGNRGTHTMSLAEFVDIYPTLVDLAGLPKPQGLQGTSLRPILVNPKVKVKNIALSQYPRGKVMGRSVRTESFRYTEWAEPGKAPVGIELYDHRKDPQENVNLVDEVAYAKQRQEMARKLKTLWPK